LNTGRPKFTRQVVLEHPNAHWPPHKTRKNKNSQQVVFRPGRKEKVLKNRSAFYENKREMEWCRLQKLQICQVGICEKLAN